MEYKIKNNGKGPRGVEKAGGGLVWIDPDQEKTFEPADIRLVERHPELEASPFNDLPKPPADLAARFDRDGDGKPGGSQKGARSTRARGVARKRGKKASK